MEENPFSAILNVVRQDTAERSFWPWQLGEVVTVDPVSVKTGEHIIESKRLWVNCQIIENEESARFEEIKGKLEGKTNCSECNGEQEGGEDGNTAGQSGDDGGGSPFEFNVKDGELEVEGTFAGVLEEGDKVVLLLSEDAQSYVVLCKVVQG